MSEAITCARCGATFLPSRKTAKYCSRACAGAARRTLVERNCERCGEAFLVRPSQIAKDRGRFCSKSCAYLSHRSLPDATCVVCGKTFRPYSSSDPNLCCSIACRGRRFRSLPEAQRSARMAPAHNATRGVRQTDEHRQKIARTTQERGRLSDDEREVLAAFHAVGLRPVPLMAVHRYNIDFAFPDAMLAVEYNGGNWHQSGRKRDADRRKAEWLTANGWRILVFPRIAKPSDAARIAESVLLQVT